MTYSPPTSATMGGEYCPTEVPLMLSAPAILLYCSTAPFSVVHAKISWKLDQIEATLARYTGNLARTSMEPLSHSPPPPHCGGSTTPSACDLPLAQASPPDCLAEGSMAPLPATTEATMPSPSLAHHPTTAWFYPPHPLQTMGGISEGSMAPSPATTEAATPLPSLARPFMLTWSSPTHPLPTMGGGSAASAADPALTRSLQRLAFAVSTDSGFADNNPWVMRAVNAVARELQCWYQRHSIRRYLARQTRQRIATTTLQCWKRCIWLNR